MFELSKVKTYTAELVEGAEENLRIVEETCKELKKTNNSCNIMKLIDENDYVALFSVSTLKPIFYTKDLENFHKCCNRIQKIEITASMGAAVINIFVKYFVHEETFTLQPALKEFYKSREKAYERISSENKKV